MVEKEPTEKMFPISYSMTILLVMSLASLFYLALQKLNSNDLNGMMIVLLQGIFVLTGIVTSLFYWKNDREFSEYSKVKQPTAISFGLLMGIGMAIAIIFLGNKFSTFSLTGSIFSSTSGIMFDYTLHSALANMFNFTAFFSLSGIEIATILLTCFFVALSEEAFFRLTLPSLIYRFGGEKGYWKSSIVSLIVFGMYHAFVGGIMFNLMSGMIHTIVIIILGSIFIIIYYYTRSLMATFSFHFIYNFLVISGALVISLIVLGISIIATIIYYQFMKER